MAKRYYLLLILGVILSTWLVSIILQHPASYQPRNAHHADSFADNITIKIFDKEGNLIKDLFSKQLIHYPLNDTFIFKSPRILVHKKNQLAWQISAEQGISENHQQQIQLIDKVRIAQPGTGHRVATTIDTDKLTYYPQAHQAKTDSHLTLKQPGIILESQGMHLDLNNQQINLLTNFQGTYSPSTASPILTHQINQTLLARHDD